jgi:hypothetical protein
MASTFLKSSAGQHRVEGFCASACARTPARIRIMTGGQCVHNLVPRSQPIASARFRGIDMAGLAVASPRSRMNATKTRSCHSAVYRTLSSPDFAGRRLAPVADSPSSRELECPITSV